jgi:hypothetical protein
MKLKKPTFVGDRPEIGCSGHSIRKFGELVRTRRCGGSSVRRDRRKSCISDLFAGTEQ